MVVQTSYQFSLIANTDGQFSSFNRFDGISAPAINESGTLAWSAFLDSGGAGIYKGASRRSSSPVATTAQGFTGFGSPTINASGDVTFYAQKGGKSGIYLSSKSYSSPTITVAETGDSRFGFTSFLPDPAINNRGQVAFLAGLTNGSGLFVGNGRTTTRIVDTSGEFADFLGTPFEGDVAPSINERGTIVFWGALDEQLPIGSPEYSQIPFSPGNVRGIFLASPNGTITTIVDNVDQYLSFSASPDINNRGEVAYIFRGDDANPNASASPDDARYRGINIYRNGSTRTVVDNTGGFARFGFVDINNRGDIAFSAITDGGSLGIFTGSDPVQDKVIETGDFLDGRKVSNLVFFNKGFSDSGQIAFGVAFEDGSEGIYIAK